MFGGFQIARPYGIPLKLHWTMILLPFIAQRIAENAQIASLWWGLFMAVAVFACVALHELGHALSARGRGYPVQQIVLTPIGGVAMLARAPRRANDELVIALAGPLVSLLIAVICWAAASLLAPVASPLLVFTVDFIGSINMALVVFNMLPCFPMDGGRVYRAWLSKRVGRLEATRRAVRLGKVFALLFVALGLAYNLFLVVIAFVVWRAAAAEYQVVQMQERPPMNPFAGFVDPLSIFRNSPPPGPRPPEIIDVEVGPPPYQK